MLWQFKLSDNSLQEAFLKNTPDQLINMAFY